jgi:hypothetical protein
MTEVILALNPDADDQELFAQVVAFYHRTLKGSAEALDYLRRRGIMNDQAIDQFHIGYCDRTLGRHVPEKSQKDQTSRSIRERLERLGLVFGRGHELFINFMVFPIPAADGSGRIVDMFGRRIFDNRHRRIPNNKHLSAQRQGIWNLAAFKATEEIILCASVFDALTFWCHGFVNVSCTFDPTQLPDDHRAALQRFGIRRVLTPCKGLAAKLREAGLECRLLRLPDGLDVNAYALQVGESVNALGTILSTAEPVDENTDLTVAPVPETPSRKGTSSSQNVPGAEKDGQPPGTTTKRPHCFLHSTQDDQVILARMVDYYHQTFQGNPEAVEYLRRRGITNGQAIDSFRIGYADRTLGLTLPVKQVKEGRLLRERLETIGLLRSSGHEHFRGSITFPILAADGSGRIVDMYGRKMQGEQLRKGTAIHTHLNDCREGVWNIEAFRTTDEIVLCGSLWDALTLWNHGYRNGTTMFGPDALTGDLLGAFAEFRIKRVLTPCEPVTAKLLEAGLEVFLLKLPLNTDINAYARKVNDPADALGSLLRGAEWVGRGQPSATVTVPVTPTEETPLPLPLTDLLAAEDEDDDHQDDGLDGDEEAEEPQLPADEQEQEPAPIIRTASPMPPPPPEVEAEVGEDEVSMTFGNRRYRVRGTAKNATLEVLRVNVLVSSETGMFVDTFDLYSARHRKSFQEQAAADLGVEEQVIKRDLGRLLLKLEEVQDAHHQAMHQPKKPKADMTGIEEEAALQLLRDPDLVQRIVADFPVVGERLNKLLGYLAAVSRKLDQPLAVIIQSTSAAGKSTLMEAILSFVPPEEVVKFSAMTGQSLYYMGEGDLKNKILAIVEEEGAQRASYALKLLQSEGELRIASTGKEISTGRLVTQEYRVEGPTMLFLTTTSIQVDEELLNRCLVLTVDEDRQQTRDIHQMQRRRQTLDGLLAAQAQQAILKLHRNAQRLLRPMLVANPYAERLTFLDDKTRTRRDHLKYLTLIRTITLLHQYQRPIKTVEHQGQAIEYIEVTLEDIALANELTTEVLGRSLDDLPPQTKRLLDLLDSMVSEVCRRQGLDRADYHFSRRDVREFTAWGNTQLKVHLKRLEEMEYLLVHRDEHSRRFVYELAYQPPHQGGGKVLAGLIDVDQLRRDQWAGPGEDRSVDGRGEVGPDSAHGRPGGIDAKAEPIEDKNGENGYRVENENPDPSMACASQS